MGRRTVDDQPGLGRHEDVAVVRVDAEVVPAAGTDDERDERVPQDVQVGRVHPYHRRACTDTSDIRSSPGADPENELEGGQFRGSGGRKSPPQKLTTFRS